MGKIKTKENKKWGPQAKLGVVNYPLGDFLIRLKNAALARHKVVLSRRTKIIEAMAEALKREGFLESISKENDRLEVSLSFRKKEPVILGMKLVSKPGLRVYLGVEDLEKRRKPSILLLTTPKGVVSAKDAILARVGGEVIVEVW